MKKNKIFKDSRPLEMLDYLDEAYVAEVVDNLDLKNEPGKPLPKKVVVLRSIRTAAVLVACAVLLGAAVPLVGRLVGVIPDILNPAGTVGESSTLEETETEPPVVDKTPEEYFTNGWLFYGGSAGSGAEYEGKWIHLSNIIATNIKVMAAYDPATGTTKSICVDPNCPSSGNYCPAIVPIGWDLRYIEIIGDWCVYQFDGNEKNATEIRLYNMKTGVVRSITPKPEGENIIAYPSVAFPMDDKLYLNLHDKNSASENIREYVAVYDPETDTTEYLCDEPEDMHMVGLSNKRIFFAEKRNSLRDPSVVWSTDYSGNNLKKEEVLNFDLIVMSGIYAYEPIMEDHFEKDGYNLRAYDLAADSMFTINFGKPMKYLIPLDGKLGFVPEENGKFYLADARGEGAKLVAEYADPNFRPFSMVGDHIIGRLLDTSGYAVLDIKTGELKAIPSIN